MTTRQTACRPGRRSTAVTRSVAIGALVAFGLMPVFWPTASRVGAAQGDFPSVRIFLFSSAQSYGAGNAILSPVPGGTHVWIILSTAGPYPAAIYEGTCDQHAASPTHELAGVDVAGESETTIDRPLADFLDGDFVVSVGEGAADGGSPVACGVVDFDPDFVVAAEGPWLWPKQDKVTYWPAGGEERQVQAGGYEIVEVGDAVDVDSGGEGWLTFADSVLVRVFRGSNATAQFEGTVDPGAPFGTQFTLLFGAVFFSLSDAGELAQQRVAVSTAKGVVILATGTRFWVHYDPQTDITWVVVVRGQVEVSGAGQSVFVDAGWQTWVEPNAPPREPVPATRAAVERLFPGVFPPLDDLTNGALQDGAILGTKQCTVGASAGVDLRENPDSSATVLETVPAGEPFAAEDWSDDGRWIYGASPSSQQGWAVATAIGCAYTPSWPGELPAPIVTWDIGGSGETVTASWRMPIDVEVSNYEILRNGMTLATLSGAETLFRDESLEPDTAYIYEVRVRDETGRSATSEPFVRGSPRESDGDGVG